MTTTLKMQELQKLPLGISGFDQIANGGIPEGRSTLVAGTSGSGKTLFALQYLIEGVRQFDQRGVLVTFEETPTDIAANVRGLAWDLETLIDENQIAIVDASPEPGESQSKQDPSICPGCSLGSRTPCAKSTQSGSFSIRWVRSSRSLRMPTWSAANSSESSLACASSM